MKPDGCVIVQVPISVQRTLEDPSITEPQGRLRLFGQEDHLRRYVFDFVERMRDSGVSVQEIRGTDLMGTRRRQPFALIDESLFFSTRAG